MSDYTRVYDFSVKDGLSSGNPAKKIKGSEVDGELDAVVVSSATKADKVSGGTTNNLAGIDNNGNLQDSGASPKGIIEATTVAIFYQAAAPTNWTIVTTPDDVVVTIDDENGGTTGGTGDITAGITSSSESSHTHSVSGTTSGPSSTENAQAGAGSTIASSSHTHTYSSTSGAGSAHSHTVSAAYAKCILASRDAD